MDDYGEFLAQAVADYGGLYADQVQWVPHLFSYLASLCQDTRLDRDARILVNAAIAYFVLPFDVVPETGIGAYGFVDDLFLCAHVILELQCRPELGEMLDDHWPHERPLGAVVAELIAMSRDVLTDEERAEVLRLAGLAEP